MKLGWFRVTTIAGAALLAAGCASNRAHKGAVLDPQLASSIQPGVDNKTSVQKLLGTPTLAGEFTPNDWYYVSRDTNQLAFRNPRVTNQLVMLVRFDPAGNVSSIQRSGRELILGFNPSRRQTPTLGRKKSFFDELFGNIGSVSSGGLPGGGGGGGNGP
ncbi:MAG TPA: outer membrane protein assembly factor BamE [Sphingomicrobium sp.]|jgi:outer membrane protein assembly factor BamE (lipoprotein component of BamABCDE complex)|nr:outer membrane protein assembly factor BamE [Sphingomicrobium sp.]